MFGLGLVGLLAVQMLVAAGVRTIGIDLDPDRLQSGRSLRRSGHQSCSRAPIRSQPLTALTGGQGVDGVLITASAKHDSIVSQSAKCPASEAAWCWSVSSTWS